MSIWQRKDTRNELPEIETGYRPQGMRNAIGLLLVTMVLLAFGLNMVYSAASGDDPSVTAVRLFRNQLLWATIGSLGGLTAFALGYKFFCRRTLLWLAGCAVLLLWARCSKEVNGAHRWIHLAGFTFQPSELTKIAVAIFVADYCADHVRTFGSFNWKVRYSTWPLGVAVGCMVGLILLGKDLGTSALVALVAFLTMFLGGLRWYYWLPVPVVITGGVFFIKYFDPMRWSRMTTFLDPEKYKSQGGYQLSNAFYALGDGFWFGRGLGNSRQKAGFLPENHTDFIMAIIGEELGFCGVLAVITLFILWGFFAFRIAIGANSRKAMLLGGALTLGVVLQAIINLGVVSGTFPTKGMPAPFLSYGGSNMVCSLLATGLLVAIAMDSCVPDYNEKIARTLREKLGRR